jgi:hypothetical protein
MTVTDGLQAAPPDRDRKRSRARRRTLLLALAGAAILAAGLVATVLVLRLTAAPSGALTDLNGHQVALDPGDLPGTGYAAQQGATDSGHGRFEIPSVGLNVPLGALNEVDGVITPPGFTSVYWVRDRGVAPNDAGHGTVFVVTHSLRDGGRAPGNYLIDVQHAKAAIPDGTTVIVDGVHYTVDGSGPIDKPQLAGDASVWANSPNRLVIITCLQVPANTESVQNMVITATRQP